VHTWSALGRCWGLLHLQGKAEGASVGGAVPDDESAWLRLPQQLNCCNNPWVRGRYHPTWTLCPQPDRVVTKSPFVPRQSFPLSNLCEFCCDSYFHEVSRTLPPPSLNPLFASPFIPMILAPLACCRVQDQTRLLNHLSPET
jgi:hypothetical protein